MQQTGGSFFKWSWAILCSQPTEDFFFCLFSKPKYGSIRWWSLVIIFFWFMKEKIGLGFQHLRDWGQCLWWARWDGNSKTVGGKTKTMNWMFDAVQELQWKNVNKRTTNHIQPWQKGFIQDITKNDLVFARF